MIELKVSNSKGGEELRRGNVKNMTETGTELRTIGTTCCRR